VISHSVTFHKAAKGNPATLVFSFSQLVGNFIVQPFEIVVPVPSGEEEHAGTIIQQLGGDASSLTNHRS
jgi:hypothetical protein